MRYDLTERLKFGEDPVLVVKDAELTVRSDAETVLRLMDVLRTKGEAAGAMEALDLLLSEKDRKKLSALHLKLDDYIETVKAAVQLALGSDPEEENARGE